MPDQFTRDFAVRQITTDHALLVRDAEILAKDTRNLADALARSSEDTRSGEASAIAQAALQLAVRAARLQGLRDGAAYLADAQP
ncbi:hypothetical protein OG455_41540 [Kitasatospora sp. NBC_01287]|uniref:hypothetical protein n=1 Tax=Kitasatospora sp. NBC_01287 TaxID=2903573 RepID=UPI002254E62F|nr:hypothetical protein [Kitasatospora sp. NBC_01287]MCX4750968.1 hypothetical protein [Kitasatospora sp. NBC_01287]MCX4751781.1 hypothetical protein [Kitasatospora sp. NBC_01287]MCX4751927.1 hypothetical protein [Kitasatospora sp. NBC_01287]